MNKDITIVKEELKDLEIGLKDLKEKSNHWKFQAKKAKHNDFLFDMENFEGRKSEVDELIQEEEHRKTRLQMVIDETWNIDYHSERLEEAKRRLFVLTQNPGNESK